MVVFDCLFERFDHMRHQPAPGRRTPRVSGATRDALDAAAASLAARGRSFARRDIRARAARAATAQTAAFRPLPKPGLNARERAVRCRRMRAIGHRIHRVVNAPPDYRSARTRAVLLRRLRIALGREMLRFAIASASNRRAG